MLAAKSSSAALVFLLSRAEMRLSICSFSSFEPKSVCRVISWVFFWGVEARRLAKCIRPQFLPLLLLVLLLPLRVSFAPADGVAYTSSCMSDAIRNAHNSVQRCLNELKYRQKDEQDCQARLDKLQSNADSYEGDVRRAREMVEEAKAALKSTAQVLRQQMEGAVACLKRSLGEEKLAALSKADPAAAAAKSGEQPAEDGGAARLLGLLRQIQSEPSWAAPDIVLL